MMKVKELARILNGIDGNFSIPVLNKITIDYSEKKVRLSFEPAQELENNEFKPWSEETETETAINL